MLKNVNKTPWFQFTATKMNGYGVSCAYYNHKIRISQFCELVLSTVWFTNEHMHVKRVC